MMERHKVMALLDGASFKWKMTGSRYICDPAPKDTDEDYIALMGQDGVDTMIAAGFVMNTDEDKYEEMPDFLAMRCGEFNVVATDNVDFYIKFCAATEQAKKANLLDKADRIALFQSVLYGVPEMAEIPL